MEKPINQRIKFLLEALKMSARDFSRAVGVPDNNTQNYLEPRFAQPKADYLEKIMLHFGSINSNWLLTGNGEPFSPQTGNVSEPLVSFSKNNYGNNVGSNRGTVSQQMTQASADIEKLQTALAMAQQEIENLRTQLSMQAALLAAKDETIDLLKSAFTRPN